MMSPNRIRKSPQTQKTSLGNYLSVTQTGFCVFCVSSYQFLEDAYKNHRLYLENMTHQLQEKRKGIEELSGYINKG